MAFTLACISIVLYLRAGFTISKLAPVGQFSKADFEFLVCIGMGVILHICSFVAFQTALGV